MSRHALQGLGLLFIATWTGCFYIPMWRVPTPPHSQCAEDTWGDVVDFIGNQSPIDRPWHDPMYCPQGVYRVAPPGSFIPVETDPAPAVDAPPMPAEDDLGDLKPPMPLENDQAPMTNDQ